MYSIKPVLHNRVRKDGCQKVIIQIICGKHKTYQATRFRAIAKDFADGAYTKHGQKNALNLSLKNTCNEIEGRLLAELRNGDISKEKLRALVSGKIISGSFTDFVDDLMGELKGKFSPGYLSHYKVLKNKVKEFEKDIRTSEIDANFLRSFESHLRTGKLDSNTVQNMMKIFVAILNKAVERGVIKKVTGYKQPRYKQKLKDFLTEDEIKDFQKVADAIQKESYKRACYYFLLSCYTGFRISDAKTFTQEKIVNGQILMQAKKNGRVVSIPIFPTLKKIIDYVKDNPIDLSEDKTRKYLKEVALLAGIKKEISFHTGRRTFAMMLLDRGFSIEEIAELIGDSEIVAKIYVPISNKHLKKKIMESFN